MDCIFCEGIDTAIVEDVGIFCNGIWRVECVDCGARGQTHLDKDRAEQEWQRVIDHRRAWEAKEADDATR